MIENQFLEVAKKAQEQAARTGYPYTPPDSLAQYGRGKDLYDCPICENTTQIPYIDEDGNVKCRVCECLERRNNLYQLKKDGLLGVVQRCTFDNYETPTQKHEEVKAKFLAFVEDKRKPWLFISGRSRSGKTHICSAAFASLIEHGRGRYMKWMRDSQLLKALQYEEPKEYDALLRPLLNTQLLYIDDLLVNAVTAADMKLAYVIIDARRDGKLQTIISTERSLQEIGEMQDGGRLANRIAEMSRSYILHSPDMNWGFQRE